MIFAVDIGGTQIKAARVDDDGRILDSRKVPTPESLDAFRAMAGELASELGAGVAAVGVGCKGIINPTTTKVEVLPGTLHYLEGQFLCDLFACGNVKVAADNDARVALVGEQRWGAARGHDDVVMLTLGTGVGGGVISGGRVVRGAIGAAGHLGHYTIDPDGLPCICGNRGCVETVFSSKAIEAAAFSALHRGVATSLAGSATCHEVFVAAEAGDAVASDIITHAITALAGALAGLCFIFDPDLIVIGGQIADAGEFLLGPLRSQVWQRTVPLLRREIPLVRTTLADPSGVLGAAALAMQH